jgi:hypothetical protein
LAAWNLP